jgi:hypothetical protein
MNTKVSAHKNDINSASFFYLSVKNILHDTLLMMNMQNMLNLACENENDKRRPVKVVTYVSIDNTCKPAHEKIIY